VFAAALAIALLTAQPQTTASRIVLVSTAVSGRALVDLGVDDFVVEEAGATREILDVHIADYPIVVLLDNGTTEIAAVRDAAARFVLRVGERSVAVGTLAEPGGIVATFDDDRAGLLAAIRQIPAKPETRLVPLDAVAAATRVIKETGSPFSAVVIISNRAIAPAELGSADLLTPILDSHATVHVIGKRPAAAPDADPQAPGVSDVLREIASLTHGQYTTIYTSASYAIALDRLADRLATEMMIQYLAPQGAASASGSDVRVGVKIPGARVTGLGVSR